MKTRTCSLANLACTTLLLALIALSCSKNKAVGPAIIAGKLPDLASAEIKTLIGDQEFLASTDTEGNFHMELEITRDYYLWFSGIGKDLYIVPGDSMYISTDNSGTQPLVFSGGESGLINTWYAVKDSKLQSLLDTVDIKSYYSQDPASYKSLNTWIITEFNNLLDQFNMDNPGIKKAFIALEKKNIKHYWYYELNVYHLENAAYTGKKPDLPEDFYDYLGSVLLNDTLLFQYPGYRYFLYSWLDLQVHLQNKGLKGVQKTHQIFDIAEESFTVPYILTDITWENLRLQNSRMLVDEEIIARAETMGVNEENIEAARQYMERLHTLSAGNPAPDFEIVDVKGEIARLKDFGGKYLLIDTWSHTCGPCIREIPRLEDLKHDLQGRNIEIIAVCLSNEGPWRTILEELRLSDNGQYRADKGWSSKFNNSYLRGSGVPVYIIIDPNGVIVNARAPYPSQGLRELLEGLPI